MQLRPSILPLAEIEPVSKDRKQLTAREMPFKLSTHTKRIQLVNPDCSMSRRFAKSRPRHAIGQARTARTRNCAMLKSVQQRRAEQSGIDSSLPSATLNACRKRVPIELKGNATIMGESRQESANVAGCWGANLASDSRIGQRLRANKKKKPCERSYGHRTASVALMQPPDKSLHTRRTDNFSYWGSLADYWQSTTPDRPRTVGVSPRNPRLHAAMVNRADNRIYQTEQFKREGRLQRVDERLRCAMAVGRSEMWRCWILFIRFVVGLDDESHRSQTGLITEARLLRDAGSLDQLQVSWLEDTYAWFNENLPTPPFKSSNWPRDAVAWFKDDAGEPIRKMWEIAALQNTVCQSGCHGPHILKPRGFVSRLPP